MAAYSQHVTLILYISIFSEKYIKLNVILLKIILNKDDIWVIFVLWRILKKENLDQITLILFV